MLLGSTLLPRIQNECCSFNKISNCIDNQKKSKTNSIIEELREMIESIENDDDEQSIHLTFVKKLTRKIMLTSRTMTKEKKNIEIRTNENQCFYNVTTTMEKKKNRKRPFQLEVLLSIQCE